MQYFNFKSKKGAGAQGVTYSLIGALIVILMASALAPDMFSGLINISGAPTWFGTVTQVMVAAGIIFLIWAAIMGKRK